MEENKLLESLCAEMNQRKRDATTLSMTAEDDQIGAFYDGKEEAYDEVIKLLDALRNGQTENI